MAIDFPNSPSVGDTFTSGGRTFRWNGTTWDSYVDAAVAVTHAGNHGVAGADPITIAQSQVTGLTTALSDVNTALGTKASTSSVTTLSDTVTTLSATVDTKANSADVIAKAIVDAKGDLIVGTAADTAARLAVGMDGQLLTADSTQSGGIKWANAPDTGIHSFLMLGV